MRHLPTILLILSLPAGFVGYLVGVRVIEALSLPDPLYGFLALVAPLFLAGLVMLPFLVPFVDRMAKRDLAAYRRSLEPVAKDEADPPEERPG